MSNTAASDKTIYLDYAATTPTDPRVLSKMVPYFDARFSNPSSMHTSGRRAGQEITVARKRVAEIIGAQSDEIIFCGSGTESDNLAIKGIARANRNHGNHIIISSIEHKAVTESARQLEKEGFEVSILKVDTHGVINIEECLKLVTDRTILISVMYANNEVGTIEPIRELATALRAKRGDKQFPLLHTDACQAAGFLDLNVNHLGVDLMTINGSKIYGPKGIAILFKKKRVNIEPVVAGGEQEFNLRAGTESVPLIVGFSEALTLSERKREKESKRLTKLRDYFIQNLLKKIPGTVLNGHPTMRLPNNVHISIPNIEGEAILLMLDKLGIEASTGSACSAYDLRPSHVLTAMGQRAECIHGSIRFSLGRETQKSDLDYVLSVFPPIAKRLTTMSALTANIIRV